MFHPLYSDELVNIYIQIESGSGNAAESAHVKTTIDISRIKSRIILFILIIARLESISTENEMTPNSFPMLRNYSQPQRARLFKNGELPHGSIRYGVRFMECKKYSIYCPAKMFYTRYLLETSTTKFC